MSVVLTPPLRRAIAPVWHGGCFAPQRWVDAMSFRPFTSESYARDDRPEAWRDVLSAVGLQPASSNVFYDGHATASHRNALGVALTRISAGSPAISAPAQTADGPPGTPLPAGGSGVARAGG